MTKIEQKLKSMTLAGTISIPPLKPNLANISFVMEDGCILVVATEDLSPKLQITRTFFAEDVKAICFTKSFKSAKDLDSGKWLLAEQVYSTGKKDVGKKPKSGILFVTESAQSQLEVQAGLTAAESAEYFPPLPDDRSVNHYAMDKGGVGCGPDPDPIWGGGHSLP